MKSLPLNYLDKRAMRRTFNRLATHYDQWTYFQRMVGKNLLERLEWLKVSPQHILDVGASTGHLAHALSECYPQAQVYAVDFALNMLYQARQRTSHPYFICADTVRLPLATNSVDLILSNLLLPWCDDINRVFAEFTRVLRQTGVLLFSTLGPDTLKELRHSGLQANMITSPYLLMDMHDIGDRLLNAGLRDVVTDVDWFTTTHKDVHKLLRQLKNAGVRNFSQEHPRGLIGRHKFQAMVTAYERYRSSEGLLPATVEVIYGYGRGTRK